MEFIFVVLVLGAIMCAGTGLLIAGTSYESDRKYGLASLPMTKEHARLESRIKWRNERLATAAAAHKAWEDWWALVAKTPYKVRVMVNNDITLPDGTNIERFPSYVTTLYSKAIEEGIRQ